MTLEEVMELAKQCGFDEVHKLDTKTLIPEQSVMDACEQDKCHSFGKNWGCPPHGNREENEKFLQAYENGIIFQCVGYSEDDLDWEMYKETGKRLSDATKKLNDEMKKVYPNCLTLGAGGCKACKECARPEPCRFPEKRISAIEGYGIFITGICQANDIKYYYGEGSIAYTGALLW